MEIYENLLTYQNEKYGEKYYGNVELYNDIGTLYGKQGDLSKELLQYKKALEILEVTGKQGILSACIYQNISVSYLNGGNEKEAWKYIKKAKRIVENVCGTKSIRLIKIYNSMFGVWDVRQRPDRAFEYLQKAIELIKETHMEESESAAYIYSNMGSLLVRGGHLQAAASYCRSAIKVREKIYGEKNELTADSYELMAYILYKSSNDTDSGLYLKKARTAYIALYGNQNEHVNRIDNHQKLLRLHEK